MSEEHDEIDRARSIRWFYRDQLRELSGELSKPVSALDRGRIAEALIRLYDRTSWLEDQVRQMRGRAPIGMGPPDRSSEP